VYNCCCEFPAITPLAFDQQNKAKRVEVPIDLWMKKWTSRFRSQPARTLCRIVYYIIERTRSYFAPRWNINGFHTERQRYPKWSKSYTRTLIIVRSRSKRAIIILENYCDSRFVTMPVGATETNCTSRKRHRSYEDGRAGKRFSRTL